MRIYTKEIPNLRNITAKELEARGVRPSYYAEPRTGRYIAITTRSRQAVDNVISMTVEEKTKEPLWKQAMQLQMGRIPQSKISRKTVELRQLKPDEIGNHRFAVYEKI